MNAQTLDRPPSSMISSSMIPSSMIPTRNTPAVAAPIRHVHRERAFGVGYGNSSGYASPRQYADSSAQPRFRFA